MKNNLMKLLVIITVCSICVAMAGCGKKSPEDITEKDVNKAMETMDKEHGENGTSSASIKKIDPFENIKVTYEGLSPDWNIAMTGDYYFVTYTAHIKGSNGLSTTEPFFSDGTKLFTNVIKGMKNDDTITITAECESDYIKSKYFLTQTEKEYTVNGLS